MGRGERGRHTSEQCGKSPSVQAGYPSLLKDLSSTVYGASILALSRRRLLDLTDMTLEVSGRGCGLPYLHETLDSLSWSHDHCCHDTCYHPSIEVLTYTAQKERYPPKLECHSGILVCVYTYVSS